jgi:hypothetical protein
MSVTIVTGDCGTSGLSGLTVQLISGNAIAYTGIVVTAIASTSLYTASLVGKAAGNYIYQFLDSGGNVLSEGGVEWDGTEVITLALVVASASSGGAPAINPIEPA